MEQILESLELLWIVLIGLLSLSCFMMAYRHQERNLELVYQQTRREHIIQEAGIAAYE